MCYLLMVSKFGFHPNLVKLCIGMNDYVYANVAWVYFSLESVDFGMLCLLFFLFFFPLE